jgi:hypothetical protein
MGVAPQACILDIAVYEHDQVFWAAYPDAKPLPAACHRAAAAWARRRLNVAGVRTRLRYPGEG